MADARHRMKKLRQAKTQKKRIGWTTVKNLNYLSVAPAENNASPGYGVVAKEILIKIRCAARSDRCNFSPRWMHYPKSYSISGKSAQAFYDRLGLSRFMMILCLQEVRQYYRCEVAVNERKNSKRLLVNSPGMLATRDPKVLRL